MSFSARNLVASLFTLLCIPALVWAQSDLKQTSKTPGGSISGRITIKDRPAVGVMVTLRKNLSASPYDPLYRDTTDHDGVYRITNVVPGTYDVTPVTPAFVPDGKDTKQKAVLVGDDENVEGINFTLVRGGVITGRVTDADGRPVIQQVVALFQADASNQRTPPRPVFGMSGVQTDDRGVYRFFGLMPGRYTVAAGRSDEVFTTGVSAQRASYKQTFHPDAAQYDKATVIEVTEGSEATNVDIALGRLLQTFAVTGRVIEEKGAPIPNFRFTLQRLMGQRSEYVNLLGTTNSVGEFTVEGLIPGRYSVHVLPMDNKGMVVQSMSFEIVDQDVEGVIVKLAKGASVSGMVVIETESKTLPFKFTDLQVRGFIRATTGMMTSAVMSLVGPDGSFRLAGIHPGLLNLSLSSINGPLPPKGLHLARVEREGVGQGDVEIREGEDVTGIRVVLSYGSATLRGVVKTADGPLPQGLSIHLRVSKPGEQMLRPPTADQRGQFILEGIPAGTYEVTAMVVDPFPSTTPRERPRAFKRVVTLTDNTTTDVTIIVELAGPPKP